MSGLGARANDAMSVKCGPNHTGKNTVEKQLGENKMKTTPWNEWDYIKTLEEAKDYVEAIYEEWDKESQAANDCIVEILESYFEFMDIFERTIKAQKITPTIKVMALELVKKRRAQWEPILQKGKEMQNKKAQKSAKKSA